MPIWFIVIMTLAFIWLGYESDWMTIRLYKGKATIKKVPLARLWFQTFHWFKPYKNTNFFPKEYPSFKRDMINYRIIPSSILKGHKWDDTYNIYVSPGIRDVLCGTDWLDEHWNDLKDYAPQVELYFGNGYRQTFTLKKPELMGKIVHINTGKKYFKSLIAQES